MTEHELYHAIGNVDEAFLLECEDRPVRRIPKRFGLIAAVVALMLTACAPAAIRAYDALKNGNISKAETKYPMPHDVYDITVEVEISPDAPYTIEDIYLPTIMLGCAENGTYTLIDRQFSLRYFEGEGPEKELLFLQTAFSEEDRTGESILVQKVLNLRDDPPEVTHKVYGDVQVVEYLLGMARSSEKGIRNGRLICWSDSIYLYFLQLPESWTEAQITELVTSLTVVEDISQYPVTKE